MKIVNYSVIKTKNKMVSFKLETPKIIWIDAFVCLRSRMYSMKCGNDSKNK